jgi:hypothetical protein
LPRLGRAACSTIAHGWGWTWRMPIPACIADRAERQQGPSLAPCQRIFCQRYSLGCGLSWALQPRRTTCTYTTALSKLLGLLA